MNIRARITAGLVASIVIGAGGCSTPKPPKETGFLSDYTKLVEVDDQTLAYTAPPLTLREYDAFIIDPVQIDLAEGVKAASMSQESLQAIADRANDALMNEFNAAYLQVTDAPAMGVGRIRVAITDYDAKSGYVNIEGEMVDSISDKQVAGVVSSKKNSVRWWAKDIRKELESVRTPVPTAAGPLPQESGFLSTYHNLQPAGPSSLRYLNPSNRLARYDKFMIRPVEIFFHDEKTTVKPADKKKLEEYMRKQLVNALSDRYQIVDTPAYDVAIIRAALTDLKLSAPVLNVIPRPKLTDLGLGGVAMEGEIIDSGSSVQIAALVESSLGRNLNWNMTQFDDAEAAMRDWAKRVRRVVDEAHERK